MISKVKKFVISQASQYPYQMMEQLSLLERTTIMVKIVAATTEADALCKTALNNSRKHGISDQKRKQTRTSSCLYGTLVLYEIH
jgi:hypothetical protein